MTATVVEQKTGTAKDLVEMLRRHYVPTGKPAPGVFAPEIGAPESERRADLIWMPTTVAGGTGLIGHEIKVSKRDLVIELADWTKSEAWAKYCERWWLVVAHPSLIDGLDLPEAWGVMAPPSGRRTKSMTVVRAAPKLSPVPVEPALRRITAWMHWKRVDDEFKDARRVQDLERQVKYLEAARDRARTGDLLRQDPRAPLIAEVLGMVDRDVPERGIHSKADARTIADAVIDAVAVREASADLRRELEGMVTNARRLAEPFSNLWGPLKEIAEDAKTIGEAS